MDTGSNRSVERNTTDAPATHWRLGSFWPSGSLIDYAGDGMGSVRPVRWSDGLSPLGCRGVHPRPLATDGERHPADFTPIEVAQ